jgi:hypothetical protein
VPLYSFKTNDIFVNQIESEVRQEFFVYNGTVYYDKKRPQSGSFTDSVVSTTGTLSLFEKNVDRSVTTGFIYPYVVKSNSMVAFRDVSDTEFATRYSYGQAITGTYPLTSSLKRQFHSSNSDRPRITSLKNTLNYYKNKNPYYAFSSSMLGDKATLPLNLISVPNIFYGSKLTKGSISLKYYISGTLIGELQDIYKNGSLVQVGPSGSSGSGSVAGVVLYDEGFFVITGAWDLTNQLYDYPDSIGVADEPKWIYFGTGLFDGNVSGVEASSSYQINFDGTNFVPNITMLCTAEAGQLDHSNNPTFLEHGQEFDSIASFSTIEYKEKEFDIKNIITSSYVEQTASYEKQVFISKIGIYDENENLIAVAKLAKPIKKTTDRDFTFKLKMDL